MADEETLHCRFCERDAAHECRRCGRPYCDEHGRDFCRDCLSPASALPSATLFRGSLVALAVAAVAGIWLLVAPPTLPGERRLARSAAQNPAAVQPIPAKATRSGREVLPTPNSLPSTSPTATTARSYTVVLNDTLSGIADSFGITVAQIQAANPGVNQTNLKAGQVLLIPPPGATPQSGGPPTTATSAAP